MLSSSFPHVFIEFLAYVNIKMSTVKKHAINSRDNYVKKYIYIFASINVFSFNMNLLKKTLSGCS